MVEKNLTQDTPMLPVIDCSALLILMVVVSARAGIGFNRLGEINHDMLRAIKPHGSAGLFSALGFQDLKRFFVGLAAEIFIKHLLKYGICAG